MNLPTEVRYRPYADWTDEEKTKIRENVAKSPWRASYHIEPETGLLNDPNGFSYFNGKFPTFLPKLAIWSCSWFETMGAY